MHSFQCNAACRNAGGLYFLLIIIFSALCLLQAAYCTKHSKYTTWNISEFSPPPSRLCSTLLCKAHMMPPSLSPRLPTCFMIYGIYAFMAVGEEGLLMHEGGTVSEILTSDSSKNKLNFYLLDIFFVHYC